MAPNTRNQDLEKMQKDFAQQKKDFAASVESMFTMRTAMEAMSKKIEELEKQRQLAIQSDDDHLTTNKLTKLEFPRFDDDDVDEWLYKCEHFFTIDTTLESSKVRYAAIHMRGRALKWHLGYMKSHDKAMEDILWSDYSRFVTARFSVTQMEDPMGSLKSLTQIGELEAYYDEFDLLLTKVGLPEDCTVSCFIEGLKPEIKCPIRMFKPKTLRETYALAKLQSHSNKALVRPSGTTANY
uniref:uncharacterized protein LOC122596923 n=1 Tax=Erigeron canadensis TaxID=72917 RepID=UPI001CB98D7B|nr:uncharacterized protein LOC122596923 [Erigeron canadensis]